MGRFKRSAYSHWSSFLFNKKQAKKFPPYDNNFVVQQKIKCFKVIMTPTRWKTCGLCRRNGTTTLPSQKPKTVGNMLL